jgi:MFS family permease
VATFEGDIADRAEEWHLSIDGKGTVRRVEHVLPEARAGASLEQEPARRLALAAIKDRYGLDATQLKDVSAKPGKQKARTDWTFTFIDTTIAPLPQGEPWIEVVVAGDEVSATGRLIHVPEEWTRAQRAASTRNTIIQIAMAVVTGGLLLTAAISGMIAWSRGRYAPRAFVAATGIVLLVSVAGLANSWPSLMANLMTAAPLQLQLVGGLAIAVVGLTILAVVVGLAVGLIPSRLEQQTRLASRDAVQLGIAAGLFGAAVGGAAAALHTALWARAPDVSPLGSISPIGGLALEPVSRFMTQLAVIAFAFLAVDRWTSSWTRNRLAGGLLLAIVGFSAAGAPASSHLGGWALSGLITAAALLILYVMLLRFDVTMVPIAIGTMLAVRELSHVAGGAFPGAAAGSILAAVVVTALAAAWFRVLRRAAPAVDVPAV